MIVDGQVHGGITQGIAAALYEEGAYDSDGNLMTTTMTTYLVPSAAEVLSYETDRTRTEADNPLGVKGGRPARSPPRRRSSTPSSTRFRTSA